MLSSINGLHKIIIDFLIYERLKYRNKYREEHVTEELLPHEFALGTVTHAGACLDANAIA